MAVSTSNVSDNLFEQSSLLCSVLNLTCTFNLSSTTVSSSDLLFNFTTVSVQNADFDFAHIIAGACLSICCFCTIFGNVLVLMAITLNQKLRTVTNFLILSLAVADTLIGAIVMPFAIIYLIMQRWPFGPVWCDLWHGIDVLASTSSILNLGIISWDRYIAITDPILYPLRMSYNRCRMLILTSWLCAVLISFPCILWWKEVELPQPVDDCIFPQDSVYLVISSCISFYIPLFFMVYAYRRIYLTAIAQLRYVRQGSKKIRNIGQAETSTANLRIHKGRSVRFGGEEIIPEDSSSQLHEWERLLVKSTAAQHSPSSVASADSRKPRVTGRLRKLAREHRAAQTLGLVLGVFVICWMPFFIANLIVASGDYELIYGNSILLPVFSWLGYLNSGMNPIIYACSLRDFQKAFMSMLTCGYFFHKPQNAGSSLISLGQNMIAVAALSGRTQTAAPRRTPPGTIAPSLSRPLFLARKKRSAHSIPTFSHRLSIPKPEILLNVGSPDLRITIPNILDDEWSSQAEFSPLTRRAENGDAILVGNQPHNQGSATQLSQQTSICNSLSNTEKEVGFDPPLFTNLAVEKAESILNYSLPFVDEELTSPCDSFERSFAFSVCATSAVKDLQKVWYF